ncbi:hypothetical protein QVD17_38176 [Tagetes erecta]|uniref:Aminotransferase-like plant mobile domain-containing protein n=1 Tax=Tagetes erecta TaxID=13708 RepID=A0AAD8JVB4_TARER|nr:hypothetical protein QVD17_38176 [Tagetes erecta]
MVRGDLTFWVEVFGKAIEFDERVTKYVDSTGLGGILRCGYRKLDRALIKGLIERCRPETNTFHLPFGEVTVTLQDVNVLWGLPIEGDALLGIETSYDVKEHKLLVKTLLGIKTKKEHSKKKYPNLLKINTILDYRVENPVSPQATDTECQQRARCICLILASKTF